MVCAYRFEGGGGVAREEEALCEHVVVVGFRSAPGLLQEAPGFRVNGYQEACGIVLAGARGRAAVAARGCVLGRRHGQVGFLGCQNVQLLDLLEALAFLGRLPRKLVWSG